MFVKLDAGSFLVFIERTQRTVLNKYSTKLASKGKATRWLVRMPNGACSLRESRLSSPLLQDVHSYCRLLGSLGYSEA